MHPAIEQLRALMPPPATGGDAVDWDQVAADSGMRFPSDYRDFVELYGGGSVDGYLEIRTPPVDGSWSSSLLTWQPVPWMADDEPTMRRLAEQIPDPDYSKAFGFAATPDGDDVHWYRSSPDPDDWTILVWARHHLTDNPWFHFQGGLAAFLLALIAGEIKDPFHSTGFPGPAPAFRTWREWQAKLEAEFPM